MDPVAPWPLGLALGAFAAAAGLTVFGGVKLATLGDRLADRTGLGEAMFGAVLFGAVTSLSGIVMTATAAVHGHGGIAYSNAVGGIAAQTAALGVADMFYRRANLEHAAASLPNIMFGMLLVGVLAMAIATSFAPEVSIAGVHPGSAVMVAAYVYGLSLVAKVREKPGWKPQKTAETREDEPDDDASTKSTKRMAIEFAVFGAMVSAAGWAVATAAESMMTHFGLTATFTGAVVMGLVNAMPETITAIAAVRRGALTLAIAGVLGGNAFDALNLVVGDVFYREGSLYHAAEDSQMFVGVVAIVLTVIIVMGLVQRERRGPAGIGWESLAMLLLYVATMITTAFNG